MSTVPISGPTLPPQGRVFSILCDDPREPLHWLAMLEHEMDVQLSVFSRLSPQRLGQHLKLDRIEFKWLSETMDAHALSPSLERIHHAISTRIASDSGIIWLDAVEYLIQRQGFDSFLAFTRSLADELNGTQWTVLLPFTPLSLDGTEIAHLRREAMPYEVQSSPIIEVEMEVESATIESSTIAEVDVETTTTIEETEPIHSGLKMLSSIPEQAFTAAVLSRRIEQWSSMGFDVSELEMAMVAETGDGYKIYLDVEQRVRRAVECERRIQMIEIRGHKVEAAKMRFRIMQLTGLSNIESKLDAILDGGVA